MKIDFHSHILPGIDDGSRSVEHSIEMLKLEAAQGIDHVVATPHFYPSTDSPERFLRRRKNAELRLLDEMEKHTGLPQFSVGAEVYYFHGMSESEILSDLTIGESRYLLLEMPTSKWSSRMFDEIEQIYCRQGITPVIAHLDRYIGAVGSGEVVDRLSRMPVLVQANANFLLGFWTRPRALKMLRHNQIHLLGSDCHNTSSRPPNLGKAYKVVETRLGAEALERMNARGARILFGESAKNK